MIENWHRRHAIQIAAQLPDDPEAALVVLELAKSLVEGFLKGDADRPLADVVPFQLRQIPSDA